MKRFLLLAVAALAFVGCNNVFEDEGNSHQMITDLPTLTAAFNGANFTEVVIGDNVEYIGIDAFAECIRLSEVHISDVAAWCNIEYHTQGSNPLTMVLGIRLVFKKYFS